MTSLNCTGICLDLIFNIKVKSSNNTNALNQIQKFYQLYLSWNNKKRPWNCLLHETGSNSHTVPYMIISGIQLWAQNPRPYPLFVMGSQLKQSRLKCVQYEWRAKHLVSHQGYCTVWLYFQCMYTHKYIYMYIKECFEMSAMQSYSTRIPQFNINVRLTLLFLL